MFWLHWVVMRISSCLSKCLTIFKLLTCPLSHLIWQGLFKVSLVWISVRKLRLRVGENHRGHLVFGNKREIIVVHGFSGYLSVIHPFISLDAPLLDNFLRTMSVNAVSPFFNPSHVLDLITYRVSSLREQASHNPGITVPAVIPEPFARFLLLSVRSQNTKLRVKKNAFFIEELEQVS